MICFRYSPCLMVEKSLNRIDMKRSYRVYRNGRCVAVGSFAAARSAFYDVCEKSNPFVDVVLLVDHFRKPLNAF